MQRGEGSCLDFSPGKQGFSQEGVLCHHVPLTKLYETLVPSIRGLVPGVYVATWIWRIWRLETLQEGRLTPTHSGMIGRLGMIPSVVQNQHLASNSSVEGVENYLIYNLKSHYVALNSKRSLKQFAQNILPLRSSTPTKCALELHFVTEKTSSPSKETGHQLATRV